MMQEINLGKSLDSSFLDWVSWLLRMLWACRVSVISVIAGFWLLGTVEQAQDLFADVTYGALPRSPSAWLHWSWFFVWVFLVWAFPVHYAARRALEEDDWMVPRRLRASTSGVPDQIREDYRCELLWLPRLLGCLPFVAVLCGLWRSNAALEGTLEFEPSFAAREQVLWLYGFTTFVLLGFLVFVVKRRSLIAKETWRTWKLFAIVVIMFSIVNLMIYLFLDYLPSLKDYVGPRRVANLMKLSLLLFVAIIFVQARGIRNVARYSIGLTLLIFFGAYKWPFLLADFAPRACVVPFLFGSLVLFGGWLVRIGARVGFPLLGSTIVALLLLTALNYRLNDLRTYEQTSPDLATRQIEIDKAIEKWERANNCTTSRDASGKLKMKCPPALIVAVDGGASRAAFATAVALGYLLDRANGLRENGLADQPPTQNSPARQVFAISGVSGGAFGAASIRTALWEALDRRETTPPCRRSSTLWFKNEADISKSWRACLETLMVGDYLTPAFVGFGFRDNAAPWPLPLREDRAVLVERAFEHHFDYITKPHLDSYETFVEHGTPFTPNEETGLKRRFGYLKGQLEKENAAWVPLLLLNGTSVNDGARIIASDLISTRQTKIGDARESLYPAAYDLFEMLSKPCENDKIHDDACETTHSGKQDVPEQRNGPDVRLSTAAMVAARFPVVSPAGTIRAVGDATHGDRVVDGGYFENAGLTTALDVARALKHVGITPLILWVQNDPALGAGDKPDRAKAPAFPPRAAGTPRLDGADAAWSERIFGVIATPFHALTSTRTGHALEAATQVQQALQRWNKNALPANDSKAIGTSYFEFKVFKFPRFDRDEDQDKNVRPDIPLDAECVSFAHKTPKMTEVSMSWWLSQSVQAELDSQICDWRNRKSLGDLLERLSQSLDVIPNEGE
jgi:hypothetical protein